MYSALHSLRPAVCALCLSAGAVSTAMASLPAKENFHLFLLIGQSNMAGRGDVAPSDQEPHPRVLSLNKAGEWVPAVDPIHFDKTIAGVGLGRTFGLEVAAATPGATIGLIPCAVGGTAIDTWQPGGFDARVKVHPWDDAIRRAKPALTAGTLKGILWHQGESDAKRDLAPAYAAKLDALVARLRAELDAPAVPFVAGQMGKFADRPWDEFQELVDRTQRDLPARVPHTAYVSAEGLGHKGDKVHFNADSYREFGRRYAAAYLQLASGRSAPAASSRPNIVFLLADDLGYRDLASYGAKDIRTPVLDRLATQGVRFTQFYSNGPECSPTRTAFLTGRYQQRVGGLECAIGTGNVGRYDDAIRLRTTHDLGLPAAETSIGQLLKSAGYATALYGKWHLGYEDKFVPGRHGFDHALYCAGGGMDYFHHVEPVPKPDNAGYQEHVLRLDGRPEKRDGYFTDIIAGEAEQFIAANRDRPFFLYVPFTAPHSPFQGPDERQPHPLPNDSKRWPQGSAPPQVYAAMIERMDAAIGRILVALERAGVSGRTVVAFTSDNGGTGSARPTGLRGQKGTSFEGGVRVPCIVRWPGVLPAGVTTNQVAMTFDLTASFVRAAGTRLPTGRTVDGMDVLAHLAARSPEVSRTVFWRQRRGQSTWKGARDGALKYVIRVVGGRTEVEGLYDLDTDVAETRDLLASRPADAARLRGLVAAWEKEVAPVR